MRKNINNNTPHLKSPKNQTRRTALGRPTMKLLLGGGGEGGLQLFELQRKTKSPLFFSLALKFFENANLINTHIKVFHHNLIAYYLPASVLTEHCPETCIRNPQSEALSAREWPC